MLTSANMKNVRASSKKQNNAKLLKGTFSKYFLKICENWHILVMFRIYFENVYINFVAFVAFLNLYGNSAEVFIILEIFLHISLAI